MADLTAGIVIGERFRLVRILGRGSYGDVWLADVVDDPDLPGQVALKIYQQPQQNRATRVLLKEAEIALDFEHERLVRVYGAKRIDGIVIMWMEFVDGDSLLVRLGEEETPRPVSLDEILSWLRNIAEGLAYLHIQDPPKVHGDLKLDNVLLDKASGARLVDFGQTRAIEEQFVLTDGAGALSYLAPEIIGKGIEGEGKRYVSSDIYSFGVIAYRMLTGRFPRRTVHEVINLTPFPRPAELNPSIPRELDALVVKCLEKRPENRFATGSELLAATDEVRTSIEITGVERAQLATLAPEPVPTVADELAELASELVEQGKVEEAVEKLEKAMQRMSTSPRVLLLYAAAARTVGKIDAAYLVYGRVIRWLRNNGAGDEELRDAMEGRADVGVRLKRYEEAVKDFSWLAERWPEKRWYRFRHAVALGLAGRFADSIEVLQHLHEEAPPTALVCAKLGFAYMQLSQIPLATQYFNEALMLDQYEPVALFHMARIRAIQGRPDKAMQYLERLRGVEGAEQEAQELSRMLGRESTVEQGSRA
ncbi:MAG: protein kinase [Candidatus Thiodiazotropha sp. (ex Ctena orbiculata)]|uniref:Protein kinase n=1 Tax=Candidatus Thiodiazotropha taylori TaxID=2792791 RepID=A0A944M8J7_9GAMM|nr:protein kinase [Candidatus Thiodiazotropha taylori]